MGYRWNPDLATGDPAIDRQHKELFKIANALVTAYKGGKGHQEVQKTMEFLAAYAIKHFADEEELQRTYDYPDYLRHKGLHTEFKSAVEKLIEALLRDGPTDAFIREVYVTVGEWLLNHIRGEDFKMAAYVQSKRENP